MKKHILLKIDVNDFWRLWRIKNKLTASEKKRLTWEEFVFLMAKKLK